MIKIYLRVLEYTHWEQSEAKTQNCAIEEREVRTVARAGWLSWLELHPLHEKVVGSIPGQGAQGSPLATNWQPTS